MAVFVLKLLVVLSMLFTLGALLRLHLKLRGLGNRPMLARAQGRVAPAVFYAFTAGMLPWAKESAAKHLPTYLAGVVYHLGIAVSLLVLGTQLASFGLSPALRTLSIGVLAIAVTCGIGLLIKRMAVSYMRAISVPDDYFANILVNATLGNTMISLLVNSELVLYAAWIALFVYIPFGKIRHCWFFAVSRIQFGKFYGYRGVITPFKFERSSHE